MTKKKPQIRFAGFDDDWERRKFDEMADYKKGPFGSALKKEIFIPKSENSVKVYEQQNVINKNWELERYFITKEYANELKAFKTYGGDILVSCAGTIGEIYELPDNSEVGVINQALMRVRVNEKIISKKLYQLLFSNMIDDFSKEHSNGSAMKNIPPFADLKAMIAMIPSLEEQQQIDEFFEDIDKLITFYQNKYDKLINIKKSMLEKMFPKNGASIPEIRFAGFTGDWERRKLGDIVDVCSGKDYKHLSEGNIPVYGTGGYMLSVSEALCYDEDAIGIGRKGTIDKPYILNAPFWTVDTLFYAIPKKNMDLSFTFDIFQNIDWKKKDESTGVPSLSKTAINDVDILVPMYNEQQYIGKYFSELDKLIALHQKKVEKLQSMKKACIEKMFV